MFLQYQMKIIITHYFYQLFRICHPVILQLPVALFVCLVTEMPIYLGGLNNSMT